jgi:prepilin signal peptidase PulO-like enzyme (type II secretory pathway)
MQTFIQVLSIVYIGLIGLLIGSFLNVVIYRVPHGETITKGRSHCMACGHNLNALDLVPVFSFLILGRRCRYCKSTISWRYMIVELSTGLFFALTAMVNQPLDGLFPLLQTVFACTLFCVLLVDSLIQYDGWHKLAKQFIIMELVIAGGSLLIGLLSRGSGLAAFAHWLIGLFAGLAMVVILIINNQLNLTGQKFSGLRRLLPLIVLVSFAVATLLLSGCI